MPTLTSFSLFAILTHILNIAMAGVAKGHYRQMVFGRGNMFKLPLIVFTVIMGTGCAHTDPWRPVDFTNLNLTTEELQLMPQFLGTKKDVNNDPMVVNFSDIENWREVTSHLPEEMVYDGTQIWTERGFSEEENQKGHNIACINPGTWNRDQRVWRIGRVHKLIHMVVKFCTGVSENMSQEEIQRDLCDSDMTSTCKLFVATRVTVHLQ